MIRELNAHQMIELYGAVLPMAVLLVRDDDDRAFLSETYLQYRALMYKIASDYFKPDAQAIEEVMRKLWSDCAGIANKSVRYRVTKGPLIWSG